VDGLMGSARNVFELEKEKEAEKDNTSTGAVLTEDDFEVEYDSIEIDDEAMIDDNGDDSGIQEGSIIGFKEMQQMVAVAENDKPLSNFDSKSVGEIKRTVKQIEGTDFFEKMIKAKEDISRRIDEILNNIN
jgi:hypothetical protein